MLLEIPCSGQKQISVPWEQDVRRQIPLEIRERFKHRKDKLFERKRRPMQNAPWRGSLGIFKGRFVGKDSVSICFGSE